VLKKACAASSWTCFETRKRERILVRLRMLNVDGSRSKTGGQVWKIKQYILLRSSEGRERRGNGDFLGALEPSLSFSEAYVDGYFEEIGVEVILVAPDRAALGGIGRTPRELLFIDLGICTDDDD